MCYRTLTLPKDYAWSIAWSPDGKTIVSGDQGNAVRFWDVATGMCKLTATEHTDQVSSVAWSPDGRTVATGSRDKTVKLWDGITGECVATLNGHTDSVLGVSWSPDGHTLASCSRDKTVKLWDMKQIRETPTDLAYYLLNGWYRFDPATEDLQPSETAPDNLYQARGMPWVNLNPVSTRTIGLSSATGS